MGMSLAPRVLPEGVPADAEPVTEDQIERLPDCVQQILNNYMAGLPVTTTSPEELERICTAFFAAPPTPAIAIDTTSTSNSTVHTDGVVKEVGMEFD